MSSRLVLLALGLVLLGAPAAAQPAPADATSRIIQGLCPPGVTCRGIRVGSPTPAAPTAPAAESPTFAIQPAVTAPPDRPAVALMVTFPTGSAAITPPAEQVLQALGEALASPDLARYRFRIEGHTDTVGDAARNQALSERRAAAVRDFLVRRYRIPAARLETVGLGETQLAVPTGDNVAEPQNRRVQVLNLGG